MNPLLFLALALGSAAPQDDTPVDLTRARSLFAKMDADHDGKVSLREALAGNHTSGEFRSFDQDGDGLVTQDEFIVGYSDLVAGRGRPVAPDLANEARRLRSSRDAARANTGSAGQQSARPEANTGPASARDRARAALANVQRKTIQSTDKNPATSRVEPNAQATNTRPSASPNSPANDSSAARAPARESQGGANAAARPVGQRAVVTPEQLSRSLQERRRREERARADDPVVREEQRKVEERRAASANAAASRPPSSGGRTTAPPATSRGSTARPSSSSTTRSRGNTP